MRFDTNEGTWMCVNAELVQTVVQQKCFPEASLFPVELANTCIESAVTVHGERRQKTAAKSCEILSHTSPYSAPKWSLKDTALGETANIHFFPPFFLSMTTNFSRGRLESCLTSPISRFHISVVIWNLRLNVFLFPHWNPILMQT